MALSEFIRMERACKLAREAVHRESEIGGQLFKAWKEVSVGSPVLVRNVYREPTYWLVPVKIEGIIKGFVRILGDGRVVHVGSFSSSPDFVQGPPEVTGITQEEAVQKGGKLVHADQGELPRPPVFVHDGPIGREAWLIEVLKEDIPYRWIFVTSQFVYERPAGELLSNLG